MNPILIIVPVAFIIIKVLMNRSSLKKSDLATLLSNGGKIIDVRSKAEFKSGNVKSSINIEHHAIVKGVNRLKLSKETPLVLYCASGMRSSTACNLLKSAGFSSVYNAGTLHKMTTLTS